MLLNTLSKWMQTANDGKPLSATRLAKDTGIHPATIRKLKADPSIKPCIHTIEKIVDFYDCSPMDLLKISKKK
jgi:DNA-binding Xre family transcriptional regulator